MTFPQRRDLMYLDVVDSSTAQNLRHGRSSSVDYSLLTEDIPLCKPGFYWDKFKTDVAKPEIADSRPRSLFPKVTRPVDYSLRTDDIEWAQPKITRFNAVRHTNPLSPRYNSPTCKPCTPLDIPYSGRPTNYHSDIEGSQPRSLIRKTDFTHNPNDSSDIEYSSPCYLRRSLRLVPKEGLSNSLHVSDINKGWQRDAIPRGTNPLQPVYKVSLSNSTSLHHTWTEEQHLTRSLVDSCLIGEVPGSRPRKLCWSHNSDLLSLEKSDIEGASSRRFVGTVPFNIYDTKDERPVYNFHDVRDVPGAQSGTLRKGLATRRCLNPLQPKYKFPGALSNAQKVDKMIELGKT